MTSERCSNSVVNVVVALAVIFLPIFASLVDAVLAKDATG